MLIIGCDYHPGFQQIAWVDTVLARDRTSLLPGYVPVAAPETLLCRLVGTTKDYSGTGADIVMESFTLRTHYANHRFPLRAPLPHN